MSFEAVRAWLPSWAKAEGEQAAEVPSVGAGGCSFSDDLSLPPTGRRLSVRVRVTDRERGGFTLDFRDSGAPAGPPTFALGEASTSIAAALAFGRALGYAGPISAARLSILTDPDTWIGGEDAPDPAVLAFGMSRVFDAVSGALANAWPGRVGAGSCSLGAIVVLQSEGELVVEVLPGGEGATPTRDGETAWSGPILATHLTDPAPPWLSITRARREGSGGVGARRGGDGLRVGYRVTRPAVAHVAIDRIDNPPHGIDRAGPPVGARLRLQHGGEALAVRPWAPSQLRAGSTLVVETSGGAGHGFPGWGDIDWDP